MLGPRDLAWKLVWRQYYRHLYGRRFPGAAFLRRGVRDFERRTGRGDAPMSAGTWEADWRGGRWDALRAESEDSRYRAIAAALWPLDPAASLLDVGCGDGALRAVLQPGGFARLHGVDIAPSAIARARAEAAGDPRTSYEAADAALWTSDRAWDVVILNEVLYYFEDPEGQARRYAGMLRPGGRLVVSTFRTLRADAILRRLDREVGLERAGETVVPKRDGGEWVIRVYRRHDPPRRAPGAQGAHTR